MACFEGEQKLLTAIRRKQMARYRIYIMANDDAVTKRVVIDCADDDAAIEAAKQYIHGRDVEVWQENRRILRLDRPWMDR